ncbi:MAG TPA: LptF/LptG family permease [Phycisphaerae bacterium]|nr:LptF/LptG family permease [Phycisphaerae bacterium]
MRILHRYILKEMLKALALGLVAVTGVVAFGLVLKALEEYGLGPFTSLAYMVLSMPKAAYFALPLAAVLAGTLVYGRLAAQNELMACRASGIPTWSLFWPTIVLAAVASVSTFFLAAWPLPASAYAAKRLTLADIERLFFTRLASTGRIRLKEANFQMTVDRVVGDMLYGPTVKYRGTGGQTYCYAPFGRVTFDRARNRVRLALWEAVVMDESHTVPVRGTHAVGLTLPTTVPREEDDLDLWHLMAWQRRPDLSDRVRDLPEDASDVAIEIATNKVRARCIADLHGRLAGAVGCFGLVLVGAGLGMWFHSGHLLTAFGVGLVPWMWASGATMFITARVAREYDNPNDLVWLIWAPNLQVVALGLAILAYLSWVWPSPLRLRDRLRGRRP